MSALLNPSRPGDIAAWIGLQVWAAARNALFTAATHQGWNLRAIAAASGYTAEMVRLHLTGRQRLTLTSFVRLCLALDLDPVREFCAAVRKAQLTPIE